MGKPIAARNRYPFGVSGIIVGGAVLKDGTKLTNIKISKQRSDIMFDLLSADGATLYQFVSLTSKDKDGKELDKTKPDSELVDSLAPGTFYVRVIDTEDDNKGFLFSLQLNKVILSDGSPVYNWNIHGSV